MATLFECKAFWLCFVLIMEVYCKGIINVIWNFFSQSQHVTSLNFLRHTFWDMTDAIQLIQVFSLQMSCVPIFTVWNHHDSSDKNNLETVLQQTARCMDNWEMLVSLTNLWIRFLPTRTKHSLSKNFIMIVHHVNIIATFKLFQMYWCIWHHWCT